MLKEAKLKMAKTFDQAIADESAYDLYSSRNSKHDQLESLMQEIEVFMAKGTHTRTAVGKYKLFKEKGVKLKTVLEEENTALCTAFFKLNSKMKNDAKYKEDQKVFRGWITGLEDSLLELEAKLEDEKVIPTQTILQGPPPSDINTILLQMSKQQERMEDMISKQQQQMSKEAMEQQERQDKHWESVHKQLGKQFSTSQQEIKDSQIKLADALKGIYHLRINIYLKLAIICSQ